MQLVDQAKTQLTSGAADFRAKFMADRAAQVEADRRAELGRQAVEFAKAEAKRKDELEKIAQERKRELKRDGPGWSR